MSGGQTAAGRCVVWGGYGYGNTGDDLVLAVALRDLQRRCGAGVQVLSPAPEQTRLAADGVELVRHPSNYPSPLEKWFWRWTDYAERGGLGPLADRLYRLALRHPARITREPGWLNALGAAAALHLTGGGYLAGQFDLRHFLRPVRVARSRGLPVTTSPLGLGPFRSAAQAAAVAAALRGAELRVRDEDSLGFCQQHGLSAALAPDDGFRWREVVALPTDTVADAAIGVCIFAQNTPHWSSELESWWAGCLQALRRRLTDHRVEGFCFHTGLEMDYEITRRLFARAGLNPDSVRLPDRDYRVALRNLARYRAVVATRFHAVVVGTALPRPCVAIVMDDYYESKMRGALKHATGPLSLVNPLRDALSAPAEALAPLVSGVGDH